MANNYTASELMSQVTQLETELRKQETATGIKKDSTIGVLLRIDTSWSDTMIDIARKNFTKVKMIKSGEIISMANLFGQIGVRRMILSYHTERKDQLKKQEIQDVWDLSLRMNPVPSRPGVRSQFKKSKDVMTTSQIFKAYKGHNQDTEYELFKLRIKGVELESQAGYLDSYVGKDSPLYRLAFPESPSANSRIIEEKMYSDNETSYLGTVYEELISAKEEIQKQINNIRRKMYEVAEAEMVVVQKRYREEMAVYEMQVAEYHAKKKEYLDNLALAHKNADEKYQAELTALKQATYTL